MQSRQFVFNPIQTEPIHPTKQTANARDESLRSDFLQNDRVNRNHRLVSQNAWKDNETLLLPPTITIKQHDQDLRELNNGEKLSSLHSQLYQQTEKLKQWKISTEIQIHDKDRKITEASKTIESLRKSILELQFLNESLSSRLHEETASQEEIIQKIETTRNMCNALKEHFVKLESGVMIGENMLEKQRQDTQLRVNQYEELALRFQELEIKFTGKEHEIEKEAIKKQNECKEQIKDLQQQLNESKEQVSLLRQTNQIQEGEIAEKSQQLTVANKKSESQQEEYLHIQELIMKANTTLKENEKLLQEEKSNNKRLMQECLEKEQHYTVQIANLESTCNDKENEIRTQENDLHEISQSLLTAETRVKQFAETIDTKDLEINELVIKCSEIESSKAKLECDINMQNNKCTALEETIKELERSVAMYREIESKLKEIAENEKEAKIKLTEEVNELKIQVDNARIDTDRLKDLNEKIQELETSKDELQFQANFAMSQIEELTNKLQLLREENQKLVEQLEDKSKEILHLEEKYKTIEKDFEEAMKTISEQCKSLASKTDEVEIIQKHLEEVQLQKESNQGILEEVMDSRDKNQASSESKIKILEEKVSAKAKQISKLQSEIKTLKGQLKKEEKVSSKRETAIAASKKKFERLEKEKADEIEELQKTEAKLMEELQQMQILAIEKEKQVETMKVEVERIKNEAEISQQQNEKAKRDLEAAKQGFEIQIAEMCNTLEKYKVENEKLINAKEKELDIKTNEILGSNKILEEMIKVKEGEIQTLSKKQTEKDIKLMQLQQQVKEMTSRVSYLETELDKTEKTDVEMIASEEVCSNTKAAAAKMLSTSNLLRKSPVMGNSIVSRIYNTPQNETPSKIPQGKRIFPNLKIFQYLLCITFCHLCGVRTEPGKPGK